MSASNKRTHDDMTGSERDEEAIVLLQSKIEEVRKNIKDAHAEEDEVKEQIEVLNKRQRAIANKIREENKSESGYTCAQDHLIRSSSGLWMTVNIGSQFSKYRFLFSSIDGLEKFLDDMFIYKKHGELAQSYVVHYERHASEHKPTHMYEKLLKQEYEMVDFITHYSSVKMALRIVILPYSTNPHIDIPALKARLQVLRERKMTLFINELNK
jgi:hypothetical protein